MNQNSPCGDTYTPLSLGDCVTFTILKQIETRGQPLSFLWTLWERGVGCPHRIVLVRIELTTDGS